MYKECSIGNTDKKHSACYPSILITTSKVLPRTLEIES